MLIAMPVALIYVLAVSPFVPQADVAGTNLSWTWAIVFWALVLASAAMFFRAYALRPVAQMRRACGNDRAFAQACVAMGRTAMPYGVLFGMALGQLSFNFGGNVVFVQVFLVWLADAYIERRRRGPVRRAAQGLIEAL